MYIFVVGGGLYGESVPVVVDGEHFDIIRF